MDVITSPSNPAVRAARKLARPSSPGTGSSMTVAPMTLGMPCRDSFSACSSSGSPSHSGCQSQISEGP